MLPIKLVTFDLYGTLLDWRSYVEAAFPDQFARFAEASHARQRPGEAVFPYRELLHQVGREISPRASAQALNFFADGLGFAKAFADARALQHLSHSAMIGCASNSDYRHLVDAQKTLGVVFDVSMLAEDWLAYKPHDHAWDQIVETVTKRLGYDLGSWLHVSAHADFDLLPAKARGVRTCFMPRPGGSSGAVAESARPDHAVSDVWQLVHLLHEINGAPTLYRVKVTTRTGDVAEEFLHWMRYEHGPDLLQIRGCQRFQILRHGPTALACEYVFTNQAALDQYLAGPATEMRRKGRERFGEDDVTFERETGTVAGGYAQRARYDFQIKS